MVEGLRLISHPLCPYVQRVAIVLTEKAVPFERLTIDLAAKPEWFMALSPFGQTPVLQVGNRALFESAVILEYLEEVYPPALHPSDLLARADHRGWMAMGSAILDDIGGLYSAPDAATFEVKRARLAERFGRTESRLVGPWFEGASFSLVDAVYGPAFRYLDAFDRIVDLGLLAGRPKLGRWRMALRDRPSIRAAVAADYPERLMAFLAARRSHLSRLIEVREAA